MQNEPVGNCAITMVVVFRCPCSMCIFVYYISLWTMTPFPTIINDASSVSKRRMTNACVSVQLTKNCALDMYFVWMQIIVILCICVITQGIILGKKVPLATFPLLCQMCLRSINLHFMLLFIAHQGRIYTTNTSAECDY